ncbi:hypothetical protein B0T22DRAFT_535883 [Podospora appendiculata]|uniref:Uncharacterized protein n=1 Tax=Podospora appendiculata TaxID=314037 RepID=A0AAE1CCW2_9PEZI|nr:hypothetical protein B0T22DRAFT_535883 [Podospora appendiculata]
MLRGNFNNSAGPRNASNPPLFASLPNSLGLTPLDSVQLAKNPFTVPIAADGSSTAIIIAGPPLIHHEPVPHGELLIGREFCTVPYLEEKTTLLRATLEQERLNLAALLRQNATAKLVGEVRRSITRMEISLRATEYKLHRKTMHRDEVIAQRYRNGRALPTPTPIIKQELGSPAPVQTQNHWYPGPSGGQKKPWDGYDDLDKPAPEYPDTLQLRYSESPEPPVKRGRADRDDPDSKVPGGVISKRELTSPRREPLSQRPTNKPFPSSAGAKAPTDREDAGSARRASKRWRGSSSDNEHVQDGRAGFHQVRSALVGQPGIRSAAGVEDREIIEILD